jgi:FixJ family two-component response regulator
LGFRGATASTMTGSRKTPPLITIVDDDGRVRAAMCKLVRSIGYDACAFPSAEDFLQSSDRRHTSCLICDVQLPGINGLELQKRLASQDCPPPIIFMTAYPDARARERAMAAGAVCFLHKPFEGDDLRICLERALTRAGRAAPN